MSSRPATAGPAPTAAGHSVNKALSIVVLTCAIYVTAPAFGDPMEG